MKIKSLISILLPVIVLLSCAKDIPAPQVLKTSEHNLHFSGNGGSWMLIVNSNTTWQVSGTNEWCTVDKTDGYNTSQIIITVSPNDSKQARSTSLILNGEREKAEVTVQQDTLSGDYHYELPVIFHIIYSDLNDTTQYVKDEIITDMITKCNALYSNSVNSIDMNLELVPATHTPDGEELPVAGINRVLKSLSAVKNSEDFLQPTNKDDGALLWDPNQYVNVFVFSFTEQNVLGRSWLPFTPRQNSLEGLEANNTYFTKSPDFPYGITINNLYIYEDNAYKTLAHELGHFLGLKHAFAEEDCETETDHCDDTPNYNRKEYENWLAENHETLTEQQKYQRTACDGTTFTSYNIMDYDYSYMNQFTADQFLRIRHVLEHSPLIPGPKNVVVTKSMTEDTEPVGQIME